MTHAAGLLNRTKPGSENFSSEPADPWRSSPPRFSVVSLPLCVAIVVVLAFPDSYEISVSDTQAYRQFGNSVVVPAVTAVAEEMRRFIR
jgi:site-specific DNA-cytosine methylase